MSVSEPSTMAREVEYTICLSPSHMSTLGFGDGIVVSSESPASRMGMPHQRKVEVCYQKWEGGILSREKLEMDT